MPRFLKPPGLLLLLLGLGLSRFCLAQGAGQGQVGNIIGQVRIARGASPAEPVMVTLVSRGATLSSTYTDGEGRYGFYGVPANLYHIIINDPKYQPVQIESKLNPAISPMNIVQIVLDPVEPSQTETGAAPQPAASGGNPYLVDVADYSEDFPKKAVDEFRKALKAERQGKTEDAIRSYHKALEIAPSFYPAHNQLGVAFLHRQDFAAAQAEFEQVIKLNQADTNAYFNLGNVFLLTNHVDEALQVLEEGLRKQPTSGLGKFLLGSAYSRAGRLVEAEHALQDAITLDGTLGNAHLELVNVYLRQKRTPEAISQLKFFLKSFPSDAMAPQARQVLSRLEGSPAPPTKGSQ